MLRFGKLTLGFAASRQVSERGGFGSLLLHGMAQLVMACSGRKVLTSHSSGRLRRRLTPALVGRAASFCRCIARSALAPRQLREPCCFGLACVVVSRVLGRSSRLARVGAHRIYFLCRARGSSQRGVRHQRFVLRAQATSSAALPGIQSSAIVLLTDGVACCRLTSHSSGRRRLIPALDLMFESLRYGWKPKDVRNASIGLVALAVIVLVAVFRPDDGVGLGVPLEAVVVSSGPVNVSRACGGTREVAVVRLASGRIIQASVVPSHPLSVGTQVVVSKQLGTCNPTRYEIALRK
jgi:hypothetical protein